jgi:hypothetical protein
MKDYSIITESTSDLSQDMVDELGIRGLPGKNRQGCWSISPHG